MDTFNKEIGIVGWDSPLTVHQVILLLSTVPAGGANIPLKHYSDLNIGNFPIKCRLSCKVFTLCEKNYYKELFSDDVLHVFIVLMIYMKP